MTTDDLIDHRLTDAMQRAHDDPRWAGSQWPDPVARVRSAARARRTVRVTATALGVAVLGAGAGLALQSMAPSADRVRVIDPAGPGGTSTATGGQWLLPLDEFRSYEAAHPSPSPAVDLVPSPAPADGELSRLEADLAAALPAGAQVVRADAASGGASGHAEVVARLADGTPVVVTRNKLDYPVPLAAYTGPGAPDPGVADERFTDPQTWPDGSAYSSITGSAWGYSLPGADAQSWHGPWVETATSDGWLTTWTAPVGVDRLVRWAQDADAHFVAGA